MANIESKINGLIMSARKEGRKEDVLAYQAIKAEFVKFKTAKNAGELNDSAEVRILQKLVKERNESAEIYKSNGRDDLASVELHEADVIKSLLPVEPTDEDYENAVKEYISGLNGAKFDKTHMGKCIKFAQAKVIGADGKKLSEIVRKYIEN